jgi:hypothetical protein
MNNQTIHPEFEVKGAVCPKCYATLDGAAGLPVIEQDGAKLRAYVGACDRPGCQVAFEVVQFECDGKWYIHKYRLWKSQPYGPEVVVIPLQGSLVELPPAPAQPPLVVLGPGGDYRRVVEVTGESLLVTLSKILGQAKDTVEAMRPLWRSKSNQPANAETHHEHNC